MSGRIVIVEGDLTEQAVDALVIAANTALLLGAGLAGDIRKKGGPEIQAECDAQGPVDVGGAVATGAGALPARFVIHAAGMQPGGAADEDAVRAAVRRGLELASERGCRTVAAPAIGAGIAGLPMQRCAEILLEEARGHLAGETSIDEIRFVLSGEPAMRLFEAVHDSVRIAELTSRKESAP